MASSPTAEADPERRLLCPSVDRVSPNQIQMAYGYLKAAITADPNSPVITSGLDGSHLTLTFIGQAGIRYRVETSQDLVNWTPQGGPSGGAVGSGAEVNLSYSLSGEARFYRVSATMTN